VTTERIEGLAVDSERIRWYELIGLVRRLTPAECMEPGYYRDPAWSVRDLMGHLGTWLAEAEVQFERIHARTYEGHAIDIDALNEQFLDAMRDQSWETVSDQAQAGRTRMLQEWTHLKVPDDEATWWLRKSGADHYDEHLDRLRAWVDELVSRR
jgi:Mycothiol maleylpyruvate isomerase N-terminal domain